MTQAKHSPAPWELGTHPGNHNLNIVKPVLFGSRVTVLPEWEGGHVSIKNRADALLIAAAPEMLEALEALVECEWNQPADLEACQREARAIITKATGEQ
jgi:hypothetical protein